MTYTNALVLVFDDLKEEVKSLPISDIIVMPYSKLVDHDLRIGIQKVSIVILEIGDHTLVLKNRFGRKGLVKDCMRDAG